MRADALRVTTCPLALLDRDDQQAAIGVALKKGWQGHFTYGNVGPVPITLHLPQATGSPGRGPRRTLFDILQV